MPPQQPSTLCQKALTDPRRNARLAPLPTKLSLISLIFSEQLKMYRVGAPLDVGASSSEKSSILSWLLNTPLQLDFTSYLASMTKKNFKEIKLSSILYHGQ